VLAGFLLVYYFFKLDWSIEGLSPLNAFGARFLVLSGIGVEYLAAPLFLTMYSVETHAWGDVVEDGIKYQNGKRNVLNTIHNTDDAFGVFWRYFKNSKYADNTIIVFTSDHTRYYSRPFTKLIAAYEEQDYQQLFVGRIPMIIYDPTATLPDTFNANYASSIDLAPSLLHLLGIPNEKNAFLGKSIFEQNAKDKEIPGLASYEASTYVIDHEKIHSENNTDSRIQQIDLPGRYIKYVQALEVTNRIYP
jgi:lipoteichoic acid synthase